jgi:imidazolonepropionase-like amidohydrolase
MKAAGPSLLAVFVLLAGPAGQRGGPVKVFTGARLIDGTDRPPVRDATLVVRDGRVVAAGPAATVEAPDGAQRVPLGGRTVIPGLINAHGHVSDVARDLQVYAAHGVTTVYSLGGEEAPHLAARDAQRTPTLGRARIFLAGTAIRSGTADEVRAAVAKNAASKADVIKIGVDDNLGTVKKMTPEAYRAAIDEAHGRGLRVAAHVFYLEDAKGLVDAGVDLLAHSVRDAEVDGALVAAMKARNVCLSPTLMREVSTFVYESTPPFFSDPVFLKYAHTAQVARFKDPKEQEAIRTSASARSYKAALEVALRNLKRLADAGVGIAMGTDSGTGLPGRFVGYFEWMELELMVEAGLTPGQALAAATGQAARCLQLDQELGTLQPGKWADFVVLDGDPLADISNVRKIHSVWIAGNRIARE